MAALPVNDYLVAWCNKHGNEGGFRFQGTVVEVDDYLKSMRKTFRHVKGYGKLHWAISLEGWNGREVRYSTRCPAKKRQLDQVLTRAPHYVNQYNAETRRMAAGEMRFHAPQYIAAWRAEDGSVFLAGVTGKWLKKTKRSCYVFAVRTPDDRGYDPVAWRGFDSEMEALAFLAEALCPERPRPKEAMSHPCGRRLNTTSMSSEASVPLEPALSN